MREPNGFFVTGTDTGIGKTVVSAALLRTARSLGLKPCGMKPIETGCSRQKFRVKSSKLKVQGRDLSPHDGIFLKKSAGADESLDLIVPVRFENPIAPLPASEIEQKAVDLGTIKKAYQKLSLKYDVMIVEGIGGLLVPITKTYFALDLARDLGLPLLVVSGPGLGMINHTLLTVNYAIREGLSVAGIIINHVRPSEGSLAEATNPDIITRLSPVPVLGIFPFLRDLKSATIEKAAVTSLDREIIKKYFAG